MYNLASNSISLTDIEEIKPEDIVTEEINNDIDERPIQLIDFEAMNFKLNPDALNIIRSIDDEVIVVSVVGKARTGKSYLMNLLLDNIGKTYKGVKYAIISSLKLMLRLNLVRKESGFGVIIERRMGLMLRYYL